MQRITAAIFCHTDRMRSGAQMEQELARQFRLLDAYCHANEIEVVSCYFHVGGAVLDPQESVILDMLRAARRGEFQWIVLERFDRFPRCAQEDIPTLCLHSMREGRQKKLGRCKDPIFNDMPARPEKVMVYLRD